MSWHHNPPQKTALITGITGQDGSYLAEFLLSKGYRVVGMLRRLSLENYGRIEHLSDRIVLAQGDLLDPTSLETILGSTSRMRSTTWPR